MSISFPISFIIFQVCMLQSKGAQAGPSITSLQDPVNASGKGLANQVSRMLLQKDVATATSNMASVLIRSGSLHQLYIIYDDTTPGILTMAHALNKAYNDIILLKFSENLDFTKLILKPKNHQSERRNIVVICKRKATLQIFEQVRERNLESPTIHWYVIMQDDYSPEMLNILREGTQVTMAIKTSDFSYNFFTTFIDTNNTVSMSAAGSYHWNKVNKEEFVTIKSPLTPNLLEVYSDFRGRELKSAVVDNWPFFKIIPIDENNALPHSGIDCNILNSMAVKFNFTYKLKTDPQNSWGGPQPDGTINGMIGMSARREVDFAIDEITISDARETVVDFTKPYFLETAAIITRAPAQLSKAGAIFSPFSLLVWALLALAVALIGPFLSCVGWVMSKYLSDAPHSSLQMFSFNMYRNVVVQGNLINSSHWPHRFVFFFWYLFCFYIYAFYQGTLTAVLAVPLFEKPIDSLNDLLASMQRGEFAMLTLQAAQIGYLFRDATSGIYKEIWDLFNKAHYVRSKDEGVAEVLNGKFAFVDGMLSSEIRATKLGRERFYIARQGFYPQGYGMALNSGAPYIRVFERTLMQLMEGGLIAKWTRDEVNSVKGTTNSEGNSENRGPGAFTLEHLQAAFFILGLGTTISSLVLFAERSVFYPRRKSSKAP